MPKSGIVVEIGKEILSVVEVAGRANSVELVRYTVRNIPPPGINASWLRAIWTQERFSHNRVIFTLPISLIRFKSVIVPALPDDELETAVQMELENVNSNKGEIYKIISRQKQDQMYAVRVVVIKNDHLREHLKILEQAGLEVIWSGLRTRGVQNFINFNIGFLDDPNENEVYLDFAEDQTEFGVISGEEITYRRDFTTGTHDLQTSEGRALWDDFLEEIRLSIASYKAAAGNPLPAKVWTFGRVETSAFLLKELAEKLDLKLYIPDKSRLAGVITLKHTPGLAPMLGLALDEIGWFRQGIIRILSLEQTAAQVKQRKLKALAGIGLLIVIFISGLVLGMQAKLEKQAKIAEWLQQKSNQISLLHQTERTTNNTLNRIKLIETWLSTEGRELEFLLVFQHNIPDGTRITDVLIEDGAIKDLSGVTPSVSLLLNRLKSVPQLKSLKLKGTISVSETGEGELFHLEGLIIPKESVK